MSEQKRSSGRAKNLFQTFFTVQGENNEVNVNGLSDAKKLAEFFGEGHEVIEKRVYGSYNDFAYDQTLTVSKKMLGDEFDAAIFERQRKAKEKAGVEVEDPNVPPEERIRRKALAKLSKTLSPDELRALGMPADLVAAAEAERAAKAETPKPNNVVHLPTNNGAAPTASLQSMLDALDDEPESEEEKAELDAMMYGEDDEENENVEAAADEDEDENEENEDGDGTVNEDSLSF